MSIQPVHNRNPNEETHRWLMCDAINEVIKGKLAVTGTVTLTPAATSTVVSDNLFESVMLPILIPLSANAAAAIGTTYVSARSQGSFTLTHANNAQTDRSFGYVRLG